MAKSPQAFFDNPKKRYRTKLFLLALPLICLVAAFSYIPLFGWIYAFLDFQPGLSIFAQKFIGIKYFIELFAPGSEFPKVMANTIILSFLGILVSPVPVVFAILINQMHFKRLSKIVQTLTSIPNFLSWVLIYAIFFVFFSSEDGFINKILLNAGILSEPTNLLGNPDLARILQTLVSMFKSTGWTAIIYIATITGIDPELYDAADVDGAGRMKKILHITIPHLLPTFFVLLLLNIANMLTASGFEQYYVFQNPLVIDKIDVIDTYTYRMGLVRSQFSFATAVGMFKSLVSILLLWFSGYASKKLRGVSII